MRSILFAAREFHVKMRFAFEGPMWKLRSPGNSPKSGLGIECTFCAAMLSTQNTMWDSNSPHLSSARRPSSFIWSPASLFFASWRDLNGLEAWQFLNTSISIIKHPMDQLRRKHRCITSDIEYLQHAGIVFMISRLSRIDLRNESSAQQS